ASTEPAARLEAIGRRYVAGLGGYFTTGELRALDRQLHERAAGADDNRSQHAIGCSLERDASALRFDCKAMPDGSGMRLAGRLALEGGRVGGGVVDGLAVDGGAPLGRITVEPGAALDAHGVELVLRDRDRHVRLADGRVVDGIRLRWREGQGEAATATVTVVDDLAPLRAAIASVVDDGETSPLSRGNFNRARL